jgi:hypothetical protein
MFRMEILILIGFSLFDLFCKFLKCDDFIPEVANPNWPLGCFRKILTGQDRDGQPAYNHL